MKAHLFMSLVAVLLGLGCSTSGATGARRCEPPAPRSLVSLPIEFDVAEESVLYLYGERVLHVRLSTATGESLYLNSVPIEPMARRQVPWSSREPTDSDYLRWYGSAPFVKQLMASGMSPKDAVDAYIGERERIYRRLQRAYTGARESGLSDPNSSLVALERLSEFDTKGLVDSERESRALTRGILIFWDGFEDARSHTFESPFDVLDVLAPNEEDKRWRATILHDALTGQTPCFCFIGLGGYGQIFGRERVRRIEGELDQVLASGELADVCELNEHTVREILFRSQAQAGLPN